MGKSLRTVQGSSNRLGRARSVGGGSLFSLAVLLLALLACKKSEPAPAAGPSMAATGKHTGNFQIVSASNPGGGAYTGDVSITQNGQVYLVKWTLPTNQPQTGVGIESGGVLGVGLASSEPYGVVMYQVNGGNLDGTWGLPSSAQLGRESLTGPVGLNGTYQIVKGQNPDGSEYTGSVSIKPRGKLYSVTWTLPGSTYSGVGLLSGNTFAVGWGTAQNVGVVLYTETDGKLVGSWGQPTGDELGSETLQRK